MSIDQAHHALGEAGADAAARTLRAVYTDMDDTDISPGVAALEELGFAVEHLDSRDPDRIVEAGRDADALLVGYAPITREMIEKMPRVRIIALMSMGTDNVDLEAATERGVWVTNILGAATDEVAAHALGLLLAATRGFPFYSESAVSDWNARDTVTPPRLSEHTLGIVGLGRIGLKFAEYARPLFAEVIGTDPFLPDTAETRARLEAAGVRRVELDELRSKAKAISLHVPLSPDTADLIDDEFIAGMPEGSYLVNVSRGALIDEDALLRGLESGRIAGAGLDVLREEPADPRHPLLRHPRVIVTPHVAYFSDYTNVEYVRQQAGNVIDLWEHGRPTTPVNTIPAR
ncbi:C-terminal binding protein [Ruicaihuangia caeni]|uniref:C-terminal binding protein n=1 Tax=Ruicaihuangia caeni TaxID=3042517 RepID=UPI00338FB6DF